MSSSLALPIIKARFNITRPIISGFRLRKPTSTTTRPPTTKATSRPTRKRMAKPQITMKPFRKFMTRTTTLKSVESQVEPMKYTRNRLYSRRPTQTTPTPKDSHYESTQYEEATSLRDLAVALNVIQQAPVPSESNKVTILGYPLTTLRENDEVPSRIRQNIIVNKPTFTTLAALRTTPHPLTTRHHTSYTPPRPTVPNHHPPFYRVSSPSIPLRPQSLDEDFYSVGNSLPAHSKVLLHADGVIECLDQGSFPHPVSCRKFISCSKMDDVKILGWEYTCPKNLSFDPIGGMCNWSAGLGCDEK